MSCSLPEVGDVVEVKIGDYTPRGLVVDIVGYGPGCIGLVPFEEHSKRKISVSFANGDVWVKPKDRYEPFTMHTAKVTYVNPNQPKRNIDMKNKYPRVELSFTRV